MKQFKEYPATHSMSTAWYVADADGNVAIMDYNDNGPVPWETEETCIECLIYGHCENTKTNEYLSIELSDQQIDDLMEKPHMPEDEELWCDCIFEIDLDQEEEFLRLAGSPDFTIEKCISKERGLYLVNCINSSEMIKKKAVVIKSSSLDRMINQGMIKRIFKTKHFFINDFMKDGKLFFNYKFSTAPYFIYKQPYWNELPAERLNIPEHPVKLNQFPESLRQRVPRIPIKFSEYQKFQIAEWLPCSFSAEDGKNVNGCRYYLLPLTDGTKAYVMSDMDEVDFYPYCSEKAVYQCKDCCHNCPICSANVFTDKPTIMIIVSPFSDYDYNKNVVSDVITQNSIILPFLPRIPKPLGPYATSCDAKKIISPQMLESLYLKNHQYLEDMLARYNPRAVIMDDNACEVLKKKYTLENQLLKIANKEYPLFFESEIEQNRKDLEHFAELPYQGKTFPHIIKVEEMQKIELGHND